MTYRGRLFGLLLAVAAVVVATVAAVVGGGLPRSLAAVGVVPALVWIGYAFRPIHVAPIGSGGAPPPDGAGVREPRRPLPKTSGGAALLPSDRDSPGGVVAMV